MITTMFHITTSAMACIERYDLFQTCSSNQQVSVSTTNIIRDDISIAHGTATNVTIGGSLETHHTATQPPSLPGYGATLVGNAMKRPSPVNMPIYGSGAGVSTGGIDGVKQPNSTSYPGGHWAGNDDGTPMWMQLRKPVAIEATAPAESTTSILETLSGIDVAKAPKPTSSTGVNVGQIDNVQSLSVLRPTTKEESNIYDSLGPSSAQISDGNAGGFDIVQKPHGTTTSWALPKPSNGTDVNLDEICKEYADMMDVRKLLPKVSCRCCMFTADAKSLINLYLVQSLPTSQVILITVIDMTQ